MFTHSLSYNSTVVTMAATTTKTVSNTCRLISSISHNLISPGVNFTHYAQLENTLNFYIIRPALYANKFIVNLPEQKLSVECWWNWPFLTMSVYLYSIPMLFHTPFCFSFTHTCYGWNLSVCRKQSFWLRTLRYEVTILVS